MGRRGVWGGAGRGQGGPDRRDCGGGAWGGKERCGHEHFITFSRNKDVFYQTKFLF